MFQKSLYQQPGNQHPHHTHPRDHARHQQIPILQEPGSDSPNQDSNDGGYFVLSHHFLHVVPESLEASLWHCCC